jgi:hypothetical protein
MTTTYRLIVTLAALLFLSLSGGMACDQLTGDDGPTTSCVRGYDATVTAQDFGQACTADSECVHGSCLMPNADGNITNNVFGFCTRACDCETSGGDAASIASSDPDYHCVYPGGCFVGTSQGAWRYAAPKCSDVSDCEAIDARYTDCATTDQKTVLEDTCGSLTKVCQAHAN